MCKVHIMSKRQFWNICLSEEYARLQGFSFQNFEYIKPLPSRSMKWLLPQWKGWVSSYWLITFLYFQISCMAYHTLLLNIQLCSLTINNISTMEHLTVMAPSNPLEFIALSHLSTGSCHTIQLYLNFLWKDSNCSL